MLIILLKFKVNLKILAVQANRNLNWVVEHEETNRCMCYIFTHYHKWSMLGCIWWMTLWFCTVEHLDDILWGNAEWCEGKERRRASYRNSYFVFKSWPNDTHFLLRVLWPLFNSLLPQQDERDFSLFWFGKNTTQALKNTFCICALDSILQ